MSEDTGRWANPAVAAAADSPLGPGTVVSDAAAPGPDPGAAQGLERTPARQPEPDRADPDGGAAGGLAGHDIHTPTGPADRIDPVDLAASGGPADHRDQPDHMHPPDQVDQVDQMDRVDPAAPVQVGPIIEPSGALVEPTELAPAEAAEADDAGLSLDDPARLRGALEAVLLVVDTPVAAADLAGVLDLPVPAVEQALGGLRDEYDEQGRGFCLREIAGGWRLYTRDEYAHHVERYVLDGQQARLTQAALETLAVVAYRQPVTRSRIAAIRGVGVDGVMRTLLTRNLVEECGTDPETGGNLYRTTPLFLEKLGLRSLEELPSLAPLLPEIDAVDDVATSA